MPNYNNGGVEEGRSCSQIIEGQTHFISQFETNISSIVQQNAAILPTCKDIIFLVSNSHKVGKCKNI